jgi:hypothetical protein
MSFRIPVRVRTSALLWLAAGRHVDPPFPSADDCILSSSKIHTVQVQSSPVQSSRVRQSYGPVRRMQTSLWPLHEMPTPGLEREIGRSGAPACGGADFRSHRPMAHMGNLPSRHRQPPRDRHAHSPRRRNRQRVPPFLPGEARHAWAAPADVRRPLRQCSGHSARAEVAPGKGEPGRRGGGIAHGQ